MSAPAPGGSPSPPSSAPPPALSPPSSASPPAPSPPSSAPPPAPSPPSPPSGTPAPSPPSPSAPGPSPPSVPAAPPLQPSAPPQPPVMPGPPSSSSPPQPPVTPAAPPASSPPTPPAASPPKPDPPGPPKSPLPQAPPADPPASSPPPPAAPLPTPSPPPVTPAPSPPSPSPPAPSPPSPSPPAPSAPSPSPPVTPPTPSASPPVTPLPSPSPPVTPQPPTPSPPSPVTPQPPTPSPPPVTPLPPTPSPPSPVTPQAPTPSPPSPVTPLPPTPSPPSPSPPTPSQPPPAVPAPTTPPAPLPPGSPPTTPSPAPPKRSPSPPSTAPSPPGFTSPPAGSPPSPPSTSPPSLSPISSSPSPTSSPSPSAPSGTVIAIAAAVAAVVVLGLVAGLFYFCRRRRRRRPPPTGPGDLYGARLPVTSHQKSHSLSPQLTSTPPAMYTPWQSSGGAGAGSSWPLTPTPPPPPVTGGTVSYADLEAATGGFSDGNLLGQGGFGHVYRGTLQDGQEVAIKKLRPGGGQGEREFHAEVEIISRVHHRNLVSLVGYCIYGDQRLLVYEYVPNKTLEFHLHGSGRATLDWPRRWKIAVGAAKGLAYLHEDCRPKIIHRDIKAANILLDYNFEPKVADFGLAKIQPGDDTHVSTRVMGTFGYLAPEYATTGKVNDRSDVFSFGVVLLELITGRRPVVSTEPYNDETLVSWARPLLTRALEEQVFDELIDPKLAANYDIYDMQRLITCAAGAVRHTARSRPRMSQIVRYLEGELSMEDLNAGVAPGQSLLHSQEHSGDTTELISRIRRMAFVLGTGTVTEDANSDYLSELTSEYGLYPSSSSSGGGDAGEAGTQTATSQPHHGAAEEAATQHYSGEVSGAAEAMSRRTRPGSTGRSA